MKTTGKLILAISLLVVVLLLIAPVQAWGTIYSFDYGLNATEDTTKGNQNTLYLGFTNLTDVVNNELLTRIEWSGNCKRTGGTTANGTGTNIPVILYYQDGVLGNGTFTWDWGTYDSYSSCSWSLDIVDINRAIPNGRIFAYFSKANGGKFFDAATLWTKKNQNDETNQHKAWFDGYSYLLNGLLTLYSGSAPIPSASFTCVPTIQGLNSDVLCTDSSTDATSWYWVLDDETRDIHPLQTSTTHDYTWQVAYAGLYSVSLRATNGVGFDWENKTSYVNITDAPQPTPIPTPGPTVAPGYVRNTFITKSATTWNNIHGSNIMLYDTYSHTWTNSTSDADGILYIDTLPYTTINAYATFTIFANEYADASVTANADVNGGTFIILMYPISSPPPDGSVNLFVSTMDGNNNVLRDVTVVAIWSGYQHVGSSGSYGTAQWIVPNNTQVHLTATKTGYDGADEIINTGPGPSYSTILYLDQVGTTPIPTTSPGATITTINPYGTPGPSGTMPAGYTNNQGQRMLDFLATHGMELVELCFMVTVLALLGVKLGK
jgi:hypothetical protein